DRNVTGVQTCAFRSKNQGAATDSTKASWSSFSHTKADHNGWSASLCLPTHTHLTTMVITTATMPVAMRIRPDSSQVIPNPTELSRTTMVPSTSANNMAEAADANRRSVSTTPRATFAHTGGL